MDKQRENITFFDDGTIRLKTGRRVPTENEVIRYKDGLIWVQLAKRRVFVIDAEDYFRLSLWAHPIYFSHANVNVGAPAYDNGYEHRAIPALIMNTLPGQKVGYRDGNHLNLSKDNLYIKGME